MNVVRLSALAAVVLGAVLATGCASGQAIPRPFPGAAAPPALPPAATEISSTPPPEAAQPSAAAAPDGAPVTIAAPATPWIATAMSLRGIPYRNGGADPSGFDCSGLVRYVFAQHGLQVPRDVQSQFAIGQPIDRDRVQPGDLVFFETVSRGASHVGIALGKGEFVHAPSSRGVVRTERYTVDYWAKRWVGARRIG